MQRAYVTRAGRILSDAEIESLADEAERGYEVTLALKKRPGRPRIGSSPSVIVPVRLDPELKAAAERRAADESTSLSEIVREALRRFLKG